MFRTLSILFIATGIAAGGMAIAAEVGGDKPPAQTIKNHQARKKMVSGAETIRAIAEVVAVDIGSRIVTLKRDDGNTLTVVADARVKNLAQVKAGDVVVAQYGRALAISLKKWSSPRNGSGTVSGSAAKPGKKVTVSGPRKRVIIADIIAIDDKKGLATLKGSKENVVDVMVKDPKSLAAVQVGDQVELVYTEAIAISIRPARTRK